MGTLSSMCKLQSLSVYSFRRMQKAMKLVQTSAVGHVHTHAFDDRIDVSPNVCNSSIRTCLGGSPQTQTTTEPNLHIY